MSTMGVELNAIKAASGDWDRLHELMTTSQRSLADASTGALPPAVRGAASSFLSAWAGYAGESAALASGFSDALDATAADWTGTDEADAARWDTLDGRLGPSR